MYNRTLSPILFGICLFLTLFFVSCQKDETGIEEIVLHETIADAEHEWFYFANGTYVKTKSPLLTPSILAKPWTESLRVSSTIHIDDTAYFLVNHLGLLRFDSNAVDGGIRLFTDKSIFTNTTTGSLFTLEDSPVFSVYQNSFFNASVETEDLFLVEFRPESGFFIPALNTTDFVLPANSQAVNVEYDGKEWIAAFKSEQDEKVLFNYLRFYAYEPLLSLIPEKRKSVLFSEPISSDSFLQENGFKEFSNAPKALNELLSRLPKTLSFTITASVAHSGTPSTWIHQGTTGSPEDLQAQATITDSYALAVFADGTSYFAGALKDKYIVNGGRPIAFKLPPLPTNFTYTHATIAGNRLYVAWEETNLYETKRSGFLTADLEGIFYK